MYWLNGIANQLSLDSTIAKDSNKAYSSKVQRVLSLQPSNNATLFIGCTRTSIYLWSVKVRQLYVAKCACRICNILKQI